jgi:hypothetical protein
VIPEKRLFIISIRLHVLTLATNGGVFVKDENPSLVTICQKYRAFCMKTRFIVAGVIKLLFE